MRVQPWATSSSRPSARSPPAIGCQPRSAERSSTGVRWTGESSLQQGPWRGSTQASSCTKSIRSTPGNRSARCFARIAGLVCPGIFSRTSGPWRAAGAQAAARASTTTRARGMVGRLALRIAAAGRVQPFRKGDHERGEQTSNGRVDHRRPRRGGDHDDRGRARGGARSRPAPRRHSLERVVVVNLATTEPIFTIPEDHLTLAALEESLTGRGAAVFRPSTLYAHAAIREGAAFINFAASPAALAPAVRELAEREGVPFAGTDGKTGETLVKSALASRFRERDLQVLAWHGENLLGNSDGAALKEPEVKAAKVETKDGVVRGVLGYSPETSVEITYVPSLGDWKTAWDLIHFQGFLGTRMTMQFTWQGCDSILAAPLVIDLVRLADLALRRGESGPMTQAACFFKAPVGTQEQDLGRQYAMLDRYLRRCRLSVLAGGQRAVS